MVGWSRNLRLQGGGEGLERIKEILCGGEFFVKGIDCDYERSGYLLVGTSPGQVKRVEHDFKIIERWGITGIERWDRERLAAEFKTDFYKVGWFEPRCGIVQPAKLARGMKALAESNGVVIYENSPVTGFSKPGTSGYAVKTETGEIRSEYLVFATNAYSIPFPPAEAPPAPDFHLYRHE